MFIYKIVYLLAMLIKCVVGKVSIDQNGTKVSNHYNVAEEISRILNNLQRNDDKRVRPNYGEEAVCIGVTIHVISISSVSEVDMDYTMDFYFRQSWNDPRLKFKGPNGLNTISVAPEFANKLWIPDTYFSNEKQSYFHTKTTPNEYLRISMNGDVLRSIRLTMTASCPMDLRYFPMDTQLCSIEFQSYGYTTVDIRYKWENGLRSVVMSSKVSLPQFKVLGYKQSLDSDVQLIEVSGNYSRLTCDILFSRSMGYYLIQIYIPAGLIVIISWMSFWLSRNVTSARVALGVTTVLTMATLMSSANATLPKISYVKAMDVYLPTCFLMVFASLLQNAAVGYMKKRILIRKNKYLARHSKRTEKIQGNNEETDEDDDDNPTEKKEVCKSKSIRKNNIGNVPSAVNIFSDDDNRSTLSSGPGKDIDSFCGLTPFDIDKYSRFLFPVGFITFNLLYWIIYLHISNVEIEDLILLEDKL